MEKIELCRELHRPATDHWQLFSHTVVSSKTGRKQAHNFSGDETTKRHRLVRDRLLVFNTTFNNISVMS